VCPELLSSSVLTPPISNPIRLGKCEIAPEQFKLSHQLKHEKRRPIAYSIADLGKPLWVDLVLLELLEHSLGENRKLIAESTGSHTNMFTSVKEVEAQFR